MLNTTPSFGPRSLRWLLLWLFTQVILTDASPTPAAEAVDKALIKRDDQRKLYPDFPKTYLGRVEKGLYFLELLPLGNKEAQKKNRGVSVISPFQDYKDLERWGWSPSIARFPYNKNLLGKKPVKSFITGEVDDIFSHPDMRVDEKANIAYLFDNDMPFKKKLKNWFYAEPSEGTYQNIMNAKSGAIIFDNNYSPQYQVAKYGRGTVPDLNALSDVVFFQWLSACKIDKVDPKELKVAFRMAILTKSTVDIIEQALSKAKYKLEPGWDNRKVFTMRQSGGMAILGSAHGAGLAWLLLQHKDTLGVKTITEVAVWQGVRGLYNLRFKIKDV
ncbi:hypothetical protein LZ31DRAFT_562639 [Colletotrichum somersetense]|nr:hypothetical protein LZ31DRAFT_562639 [Colletotrichum somersetense]